MENRKNIWFDCMCEFEGNIYAPSVKGGKIIKIDPNTFEGNAVIELPNSSPKDHRKIGSIISFDSGLILLPDKGEMVYIIDEHEKKIHSIYIKKNAEVRLGMYIAYYIDNFIYIISTGLNKILKVDLKQKTYSIICDLCCRNVMGIISKDFCVKNNIIYFILPETSILFKFSIKNENLKAIKLEGMYKPNTVSIYENRAIFTSQDNFVTIYDLENENIQYKIKLPNPLFGFKYDSDGVNKKYFNNDQYDKPCFQKSLIYKSYVIFIPYFLNNIVYIDLTDYTIHSLAISQVIKEDSLIKNELVTYRGGVVVNDLLILYMSVQDCYIVVDLKNMILNTFDLTVEYNNLIYEKKYMKSHLIYEEKDDLNRYIEFLIKEDN